MKKSGERTWTLRTRLRVAKNWTNKKRSCSKQEKKEEAASLRKRCELLHGDDGGTVLLFALGADQSRSEFDAMCQVFFQKFEVYTFCAQMPE